MRASEPKSTASSTAPDAVKSHPSRLIVPYGAKAAGSRNTPEPIMLPITKAVHIHKPSPLRVTNVSPFEGLEFGGIELPDEAMTHSTLEQTPDL